MSSRLGTLAKFSLWAFILLMSTSIILAVVATNVDYIATPYSVTSSAKNGLSNMRNILEREGFDIKIIVSDPESVVSLEEPIIYAIFGPTLDYDLQAIITLASLLQNGSSLLIVDDFGRINSILNTFFSLLNPNIMFQALFGFKPADANITRFSVYVNTSAVVLDASSYWKNPANIIIRDFDTRLGIFSSHTRQVLARFASSFFVDLALNYINGSKKRFRVPLPGELGVMRTSPYSWLETDIKSIIEGTAKPDPTEYGGMVFALGLAFRIGESKVLIITDPDIFTNEAIELAWKNGFDNEQLIHDIFSWLSDGKRRIVVFDESRKAITPENPLFGIAVSMKVVTFFTRYWIVAPLIPIIFVIFFIAYIPRQFRKEIRIFKITRKKEGVPPYYGRYVWYMYRGGYKEAFKIIMSDFKRAIQLKTGITKTDWSEILELLRQRRQDLAKELEELGTIVGIWDNIIKGKKVRLKPEDYIRMFETIKKIRDKL